MNTFSEAAFVFLGILGILWFITICWIKIERGQGMLESDIEWHHRVIRDPNASQEQLWYAEQWRKYSNQRDYRR